MRFLTSIKKFFRKHFFNPKWKCISCGKEIFDGSYFCPDCKESLPLNDKSICDHCGRELLVPQEYCSTCKGELLTVDFARSVFTYRPPISTLIKKFKFGNKRYLAQAFCEYLSGLYLKCFLTADVITFVPMTKKSLKRRGYNQGELLAKGVSEKVGVPCENLLVKKSETERQVKLDKSQRLKNLVDAFKVVDRKKVKNKTVVIIDDVSTTGATGEAVGSKLKKAGAKKVILLTIASVPPINGY